MIDPCWMLLAMHQPGDDCRAWGNAGAIDFVAPGCSGVQAHFQLQPGVVDALRAAAAGGGKALRWFETGVTTASGDVVARVRKQLYVRMKPARR